MCRTPHHRLGGAPVLVSLAAGPRRIARAVARGRGARLRHSRADPRTALVAFTALRADTVALVRRLAPAQRRAAGRHPEYGRLRIDQMLHHWAEHDLIHLEQIQATLKPLARS